MDTVRINPFEGALSPRRLTPGDAPGYVELRRRMLADAPWAFAASPSSDRLCDPGVVGAMAGEADKAVLVVDAPSGAAGQAGLVATAMVVRERHPKLAHRAAIYAVYVEGAWRGHGVGRAVVSAAIEAARGWAGVDSVRLGVSARSPEARRLYERLGFVTFGVEPEAVEVDAARYDEIHMLLRW